MQRWLDGGAQDPFHGADEQAASTLHVHMQVWPGGHDFAYWNAHWGDYLGFYPHRSLTPDREGAQRRL